MARKLAAIKLRSMWNTLRAQTWVLVVSLIAYVYGLVMVVFAGIGLIALMYSGRPLGADLMIALGGAFVLGWVVLPLIFASQEGTVDPPKLAPFLAPSRKLAWSLVLITGVGAAGVYYLMVAIIQVIGWASRGALPAILAVIGATLAIAISFTWTRAASAWAGRRQTSRSGRDRAGIIGFVILMVVFAPMGYWLPVVIESTGGEIWSVLLHYVRWTPFGAPWALPAAAEAGQWAQLGLFAALAVATLALGWWVWLRQLEPSMTGTRNKISADAEQAIAEGRHLVDPSIDASGSSYETSADGAPRYLPGADRWLALGVKEPTAAIAERTRIYWIRDPRLIVQMISGLVLVLMGILLVRVLGAQIPDEVGAPSMQGAGVGMVVFSAFIIGTVVGTLLQYDSTALWVEISAGVRGRYDRAGRFLGTLGLASFVIVLSAAAFGLLAGLSWGDMLLMLVLMMLLFCCSAAATTIIGSQWVYPVQPPGASPMSTKGTGQFLTTMLVGLAQIGFAILLAAVPMAFLAWMFFTDSPLLVVAALFAVLWTVGITYLGIFLGGKIFDRSQVELLSKISAWPGHGIA